jgi:hypothetical protein
MAKSLHHSSSPGRKEKWLLQGLAKHLPAAKKGRPNDVFGRPKLRCYDLFLPVSQARMAS